VCGEFGHKAGPICPLDRKRRSCRLNNTKKANRFLKWILNHFPLEKMREGGGVIDVAGGQGRLSTALQLQYRVKSLIIDPRPYTITVKQGRFYNYQVEHPEEFTSPPEYPKQMCILLTDEFWDNTEYEKIWKDSSLIVGLHPDEATERIVLFALKYKKPFAVVPCCVFPNKFPKRKNKEGAPVRRYHEFCQYLQELDPDIKRDTFKLPGRNTVIYKFEYN